ncbi:hypothetical protein LOTGIDRAFT_164437 [Lottia gigantea]|uniref:Uncharacterized protein n=1 Tax=Lottia gigantea TaxID=225164 RepID=V4BMH4_LOTGI|nr:hypothetical protein LOTGIDRAFT_164437 [Lottia gigantea]ESO90129.1 hypothetical protein LOTGIDRAFT_164437 [Lottia gigantea]
MGNSVGVDTHRTDNGADDADDANMRRTGPAAHAIDSEDDLEELTAFIISHPNRAPVLDENIIALCCVDPSSKSQKRHPRRQVLMKDIFPKVKRPRVHKDAEQFWISPFEHSDTKEPIFKTNGSYDPREPGIKHFPCFLDKFLNKDFHLHMKLRCTNAKPEYMNTYPEISYLMRNIKYVKVHFKQTADQRIQVFIEESHGRRKNTSPSRLRKMYVKLLMLDHLHPSIMVSGGEFLLNLYPAEKSQHVDWKDSNGELPSIVGHYCRELDTNPNIVLEWSVSPKKFFNRDTFNF